MFGHPTCPCLRCRDCSIPVVFVPGNHDPEVLTPRLSRGGLCYFADGRPCDAPRPCGAINADVAVVDVAGLRIAGLGGCVRYNDGPNQPRRRAVVRDSGFPRADAESDVLRARRHQTLSALAARMRSDSQDTVQAMSFDEVVEALGRRPADARLRVACERYRLIREQKKRSRK